MNIFNIPPVGQPRLDEKYWNPKLETMNPQQRNEAILKMLKQQISYAYEKSTLYRLKYREAGIHPDDIRSFRDFERLPFITKQDLRDDQAANPPFGGNLCIPKEMMWRVHGTSGTTGKPVLYGISRDDIQRIGAAHARVMWSTGIRPQDIMAILAPFSLYVGGWDIMYGCDWMNMTCFPFGAGMEGQSRRTIPLLKEIKPTAIYSTIGYAFYLAEVAKEMRFNPSKDFTIRTMMFSGEAGAGMLHIKKNIERLWNAISIDCGSTSEMSPWLSNCECNERTGMHLWQDIVYAEVIDPKTREPVDYGEEGVITYTHLGRESHPMIRFWSNDITTWSNEGCPCGRTYPSLPKGIYGRYDDMFTIRGVNVWATAVENTLRTVNGFGGEFRCIVDKTKRMDILTVEAEFSPEIAKRSGRGGTLEKLKQEMARELKTALGVSCSVTLLTPRTIPRSEKHKRSRIVIKS